MSFPAFWREEPLDNIEQDLLDAMIAAHDLSARRHNISTVTALNTYKGSGSIANAIAAACLTIGGAHAPVDRIMEVLTEEGLGIRLDHPKAKIPGWGSDFVKGEEDEDWKHVKTMLEAKYPDIAAVIDRITGYLHAKGKMIYPNPGCYTAAVAICLGVPNEVAPSLFILARIPAWASIILAQ